MSYFSKFPDVYVAEGVTTDQAYRYRLVKNIFRRIRVREDLDKFVTSFERISVPEGMTPSNMAVALFEDPFLDWVILITNNITDVYEQWPKTESELQRYVRNKYPNPEDVTTMKL